MSVRVRCVQCQRSLKVPEAAVGKKVQCPVCGARFVGTPETDAPAPPPPPPPPPAPVPAAVPPKPDSAPWINLQLEDLPRNDEPPALEMAPPPAARKEPAAPPPPPAPAVDEVEVVGAAADEPAAPPAVAGPKAKRPARLADDEEEVAVNEAVEDEAEVNEAVEDEAEEKPKKKKGKKGLLCGCLAAVGFVLLLGCGGAGVFAYRFWNGSISGLEWKPYESAEGRFRAKMPGEPKIETQPQAGATLTRYRVLKPFARSQFEVVTIDFPHPLPGNNMLDSMIDAEATGLLPGVTTTVTAKRPITLGPYQGREVTVRVGGGRNAILRLYLVPRGGQTRVYELIALAPDANASTGQAATFFDSFAILDAGPPRPGGKR